MLVNKTMSMSASCKLTEDGENVMTLTGTLNTDGSVNVNQYINKMSAYKENAELMNADREAFVNVLASMGETEV